MNCICCNKIIKSKRNIFCNNKCQSDFKYLKYIEAWKNHGVTKFSRHIRRYLLEKYDFKCSECGWSEINTFTKTIPLEVEHIDGNSENNDEINLKILCPNCHSLTSTYKGANKGNGRHFRRTRYKNGQSY